MAVDFSTVTTDPITGLPKQKKQQQLPYLNEQGNQGRLPMVQPQDTAQGNNAVMQTAQGMAMQPQNNQLQQQASKMTQQMMDNPNFSYDTAKYKTTALSNFDADRAGAMQKARQSAGDLGGSGAVQENLMRVLMQQNTDRSGLENELNLQEHDLLKKDWQDAIATGNTQQSAEEQSRQNAINNLLNVRQGYEGERSQQQGQQNTIDLSAIGQKNLLEQMGVQQGYDVEKIKLGQANAIDLQQRGYNQELQMAAINQGYDLAKMDKAFGNEMTKLVTATNLDTASKTNLMNLQAQIDTGQLTNQQSWQATQNDLDRQIKAAEMSGNAQLQKDLIALKGQVDAKAQESQQNFEAAQAVAARAYNTGERLSTQEYQQAMTYYDWAQRRAAQENDISAQKYLEEKKNNTQIMMQMADMSHDEKMANINGMIEESKATRDLERQKQLIKLQASLTLAENEQQFGYDKALQTMQGNIQKEIASGNNENAIALQKAELEYKIDKDIRDYALEKSAQELQAKGISLDIVNSQYEQVLNTYGQEAADEFMASTLKQNGVNTAAWNIADKKQQAIQALSEEFDMQQQQYVMSHRNDAALVGKDGKLTPAGLKQFNEQYNFTMYGEETPAQKEAKRTAGYLGASDLSSAQVGDKFKIDAATTYNGVTVPAGEYSVVEGTEEYGSKFFGTKGATTKTYLVDSKGNKIQIEKQVSGKEGNIVSNLWAGDIK